VLFFTNDFFDSCQVLPATVSAIAAVRTTVPAATYSEDESTPIRR
jgi:hypothetical protein